MPDALFSVDTDTRRIRVLAVPYGELSRPSVSGTAPIQFSTGTVALPSDPAVVSLSDGHPAPDNLIPETRGRAVEVVEQAEGVVTTFEVARTPEGDALLAAASNPDPAARPRFSPELKALVRRGTQAVSSVLRGVAIVQFDDEPAFQSSALFAAIGDVQEQAESNPEAAPAAKDTTEGATPKETQEEHTMPDATVPDTLAGPSAIAPAPTSADGLFAAVAAVKGGNPDAVKAYAGGDALFAISTIQHSGPSSVTIGADVQVPAYLGELHKRQSYRRRFTPLLAKGILTSHRVHGWRWVDGKEPEVGDYAGNTAEIPSNALDTEPVTTDAQRIAGGHKIDRRYLDFNDQEVIGSYFTHMAEDVERKHDAKGLAAIIAAATATTPGTVPSGVAKGLAAIVDGALDVIATENQPAYALVDTVLWRELVLTAKDDVLAFLQMSLGLEDGSLEGFSIRPATIGTAGNAGKQVIVGAREAITYYEPGGVPIRVEGIDPHHGAFDPAVFSYYATITNNAKAVRVVTTV